VKVGNKTRYKCNRNLGSTYLIPHVRRCISWSHLPQSWSLLKHPISPLGSNKPLSLWRWVLLLRLMQTLSWARNSLPWNGTRRCIALFTIPRQWTLSWDTWIQSAHPCPVLLRSVLILSFFLYLDLSTGPHHSNFLSITILIQLTNFLFVLCAWGSCITWIFLMFTNYRPKLNIIRMIKPRRMKWTGHIARMVEKRNAYRILVQSQK
jgi:hypothetical protein